MIIRLLPDQVAKFWEHVKWAVASTGRIPESVQGQFFNIGLQQLLTEKAQCWLCLSEERKLKAIFISRITEHPLHGVKQLQIYSLYGFERISDEDYEEGFNYLVTFAKNAKCKEIFLNSNHPRVWHQVEKNGYEQVYKTFKKEV